MSNQSNNQKLSVRYTPETLINKTDQTIIDPTDAMLQLERGVYPTCITKPAKKLVGYYRDSVLGFLLRRNPEQVTTALETLCARMRELEDNNDELPYLAEYVATLSFAVGETTLAKKTLLRVNPHKATNTLKNIHLFIQNNHTGSILQEALKENANEEFSRWASLSDHTQYM
jgi:hypothetical protein